MTPALIPVLIPIGGLACNVAVQIACLRLPVGASLLRSIFGGFLAGAAGVGVAQSMLPGSGDPGVFAGDLAANLVIYALLGYGYFHFINLGETGRRVRLLRELYESPEGLTPAEILSRYDSKRIIAMRLARLLGNGQIILEDGCYRLGRPAMARISGVMLFLKRVILGRDGEFDRPE